MALLFRVPHLAEESRNDRGSPDFTGNRGLDTSKPGAWELSLKNTAPLKIPAVIYFRIGDEGMQENFAYHHRLLFQSHTSECPSLLDSVGDGDGCTLLFIALNFDS
ncbi:hypothetical protein CDAR_102091 [Caerostris darwini]|uniref:Uncharacterized protein n=1 Tax=Caerostris darwini TaxID=1538125 RepID=A0AAV4MDT2_9ARAC|nr:hypothetical protein CDAR_102091 [Caerostris darwini]